MEQAIERGDRSAVDAASRQVLSHLGAARSWMARGAGWAPGAAAMAELDAATAGLEAYVTTVRESGGDRKAAEAARPKLDTDAWPRFINWMQAIGPLYQSGQLTGSIPC